MKKDKMHSCYVALLAGRARTGVLPLLSIGIWDAGWVLASHQEFDDRVMIMDSNSEPNEFNLDPNHATHVAGTIGASGDPCAAAKGMAPAVNIDSYDWYSDTSEMASRAATGDGEDGRIYLSNHYGCI